MELYKNFRSLLSNSQKCLSTVLILCLYLENGLGITVEIRIPSRIQPKIVGGGRAEHGQFPYLVSIQSIKFNKTFCGGTILDDTTIVTAAHCILQSQWECQNNTNDCFRVVAGEHDISISEGYEQNVNFSVSDVITHEHYHPYSHDNDIAIIKLKEPLDFSRSRHVQPISLVDPNVNYNKNAFIVGWGADEFNSNLYVPNHILQKTTVTIFSDLYCNRQWGDDYHKETMICAGGTRDSSSHFQRHSHYKRVPDACQGDSGGPLITRGVDDNSKWYLVGIVSWGFQCGIPEYPGLYTRVENYLQWIRENRHW